ncbi:MULTISPECIES: flagellar type III secretion system pore protein FliP [Desulfonatronospira]|uniref:flagellar type III secretion system pore protein FliP n=1 Tax=Desulfonatronospira TaxID=488937 RepID=UPI000A2F55F6|nr:MULTISPECIES: flagellar type III secretion system pore protein FliP [Desulfonatronospira]RQD72961.1 MAG: flagellar biosynthetic protein FliP [Desulfonatronospira sp. MSAO_Bac3]
MNKNKIFPRCLIRKALTWTVLSLAFVLWPVLAQAQDPVLPSLSLQLSGEEAQPDNIAVALEILFLLTILSVAPAIVLTITCFTRIIIVFSFIRHAIGTQQMPPNQVLAALAIFLTVAIMAPIGSEINQTALQPYLNEEIGHEEALSRAEGPMREFMFKHTRERDLSVFYSITGMERPESREDVPTMLLIPAFMISELKTAFQIGFLIYIPFLILDMVVASILLSMGMMMLPPVMISMPFKVLLFIMVDGWNLLVGSLVNSFV